MVSDHGCFWKQVVGGYEGLRYCYSVILMQSKQWRLLADSRPEYGLGRGWLLPLGGPSNPRSPQDMTSGLRNTRLCGTDLVWATEEHYKNGLAGAGDRTGWRRNFVSLQGLCVGRQDIFYL
jgi:hypothetical protein